MLYGGIDTGPCSPDYPCWIPGMGFRVVDSIGTTCAILDSYESKFTCEDNLGILLMSCGTEQQEQTVYYHNEVAPVGLEASLIYLAVAAAMLLRFRR